MEGRRTVGTPEWTLGPLGRPGTSGESGRPGTCLSCDVSAPPAPLLPDSHRGEKTRGLEG